MEQPAEGNTPCNAPSKRPLHPGRPQPTIETNSERPRAVQAETCALCVEVERDAALIEASSRELAQARQTKKTRLEEVDQPRTEISVRLIVESAIRNKLDSEAAAEHFAATRPAELETEVSLPQEALD